jgi:HK97 family phage prohead protease
MTTTLRRIIQPYGVKSAGAALGPRQVLATISSESPDRIGDSIIQSGIDYRNFMRGGGTVLWQHDYNYPVARTLRMSMVNGCLAALSQFPPESTSAQSDECYRLIREGIVNATSIGFQPIEWEFLDRNRPGSGILFSKVELIEFSYVSCPANPDALIIGKSYGYQRATSRADRIRQVEELRLGRDTRSRASEVSALSCFAGTLADRRWQVRHANRHAESDLRRTLASADSSTLDGRRAIVAAHRRYHERTMC